MGNKGSKKAQATSFATPSSTQSPLHRAAAAAATSRPIEDIGGTGVFHKTSDAITSSYHNGIAPRMLLQASAYITEVWEHGKCAEIIRLPLPHARTERATGVKDEAVSQDGEQMELDPSVTHSLQHFPAPLSHHILIHEPTCCHGTPCACTIDCVRVHTHVNINTITFCV